MHPSPEDPACILEQIAQLDREERAERSADYDGYDDELPQDRASAPHGHRGTQSSMERGFSSKEKRFYSAAKEIAMTAKWMLQRLEGVAKMNHVLPPRAPEYDPITKRRVYHFPGNYFDAASSKLTHDEYEWYKDRATARKVVEVTAAIYAEAEPWEPLPQSVLTVVETEELERIRAAHQETVRATTVTGNVRLVRLANNAAETQEVLDRDGGANGFVTTQRNERLQAMRDPAAGPPAKKAKKDIMWLCDVADCHGLSFNNEQKCDTPGCKTYRFCEQHLHHASHCVRGVPINRRKLRTQLETQPQEVIDALAPVALALKRHFVLRAQQAAGAAVLRGVATQSSSSSSSSSSAVPAPVPLVAEQQPGLAAPSGAPVVVAHHIPEPEVVVAVTESTVTSTAATTTRRPAPRRPAVGAINNDVEEPRVNIGVSSRRAAAAAGKFSTTQQE